MHTRPLHTLSRIAQVGSFATAARQLNMTLSAVSMQMKTLESELDVSLFDRSFRPPRLTPLGRTIATKASDLLASEAALLNACTKEDELTGRFQFGFVSTASVRLLPLFLKTAAKMAPNAQFDFETGLSETLEVKVLRGQLDAAVVTASAKADPDLQYDTLREEPLIFAVPGQHGKTPVARLVRAVPFLQFMPSSGVGKLIAQHVSQLAPKREREATIVLDSVEAIMGCVNEGIGFTLLPEPDIERYAGENVRVVSPPGKKPSRQLVLATRNTAGTRETAARLAALFQTRSA